MVRSISADFFSAENSSTGTLTRPKLIAPFQSPRAMASLRRAARGGAARLVAAGRVLLLDAGLRLVVLCLRLLLARVLLVALHEAALRLGDVVLRVSARLGHLALVFLRRVGLRVELGLGDLLLRLG